MVKKRSTENLKPFIFWKEPQKKIVQKKDAFKLKKLKTWRSKTQAINYSKQCNKKNNSKFHIFSSQVLASGTRNYFSTTYEDLLNNFDYLFDKKNLYIHEMCTLNYKTKIFMDLDCDYEENKTLDFYKSCYFIIEKMCEFLNHSFSVDLSSKNVTVLSACRKNKSSSHIIFDNRVMINDMKSLSSTIHIFMSWIIIKELNLLVNMKDDYLIKLVTGKVKRISSLKFIKKNGNIFFESLLDTKVYVNGSLRMYYSKHKYYDKFSKKSKEKLIKKENKTRLYELIFSKINNDIVYKKKKKFDIKVLEKSFLQNEYDILNENANHKVINFPESNANTSVQLNANTVSENRKDKNIMKDSSLSNEISSVKKMQSQISNFTIVHSRLNQSSNFYNKQAEEIIVSYHKKLISRIKSLLKYEKINKGALLENFKLLLNLNFENNKFKLNIKSGGEFNGIFTSDLATMDLIENTILPKYKKFLKETLPFNDYKKLKISYKKKNLKTSVSGDIIIVQLIGSKCAIIKKNENKYHSSNPGIYLVVNMITRCFYQACHKEACWGEKAGIEKEYFKF